MKTKERIGRLENRQTDQDGGIGAVAVAVFSCLYSHGISPVWTAVAIICFRGFFRFLYRVACILVALAIILLHTEFSGLLNPEEHGRICFTYYNIRYLTDKAYGTELPWGRLFLYQTCP